MTEDLVFPNAFNSRTITFKAFIEQYTLNLFLVELLKILQN